MKQLLHSDSVTFRMMIRTIIIEDEKEEAEAIAKIIKNYCWGFSVVGIANDVKTGVELINKQKPDMVTLDVNLPDGTGFDILKKVENVDFKLVFITTLEEHALKAIKFSAIDYILKPIDKLELIVAFRKVNAIFKKENNKVHLNTFSSGASDKTNDLKKIALKTSDDIHLVKVNEIIRCESEGSYTSFFFKDGKKLLVSKNLKEYEGLLSGYGFFRAHHSHLINCSFIERFHKGGGGLIYMSDQSEIPVSVRKKEHLLKLFSEL